MNTRYRIALLSLIGLAACGGGGGGEGSENATVDRLEAELMSNELPSYRLVEVRLANGVIATKIDVDRGWGHIDNSHLPHGFSSGNAASIRTVKTDGTEIAENTTLRGYRGSYASTFVSAPLQKIYAEYPAQQPYGIASRAAVQTESFDLPYSGQFSYRGYAFNNDPANDARFDYTIDYGRRRGWGEIGTSKVQGRQILEEAPIRDNFKTLDSLSGEGVKNAVVKNDSGRAIGAYSLLIAGPNAEEIVGEVRYDHTDKELYFHGSR